MTAHAENYKERASVWFCSGRLPSSLNRPQSFTVFPDHLTVSNGRALEGRRPRVGGRVSCGWNAPVLSPFRPRVSCTLCWLFWLRYTRNCRHVVVWSRQPVYMCVCVSVLQHSFLWLPHTAPLTRLVPGQPSTPALIAVITCIDYRVLCVHSRGFPLCPACPSPSGCVNLIYVH